MTTRSNAIALMISALGQSSNSHVMPLAETILHQRRISTGPHLAKLSNVETCLAPLDIFQTENGGGVTTGALQRWW